MHTAACKQLKTATRCKTTQESCGTKQFHTEKQTCENVKQTQQTKFRH